MGFYEIARSDDETDELLNRVDEQRGTGSTKVPTMTYEDGLRDAIDWLTDADAENPYP